MRNCQQHNFLEIFQSQSQSKSQQKTRRRKKGFEIPLVKTKKHYNCNLHCIMVLIRLTCDCAIKYRKQNKRNKIKNAKNEHVIIHKDNRWIGNKLNWKLCFVLLFFFSFVFVSFRFNIGCRMDTQNAYYACFYVFYKYKLYRLCVPCAMFVHPMWNISFTKSLAA